jgi:hypothetical protein
LRQPAVDFPSNSSFHPACCSAALNVFAAGVDAAVVALLVVLHAAAAMMTAERMIEGLTVIGFSEKATRSYGE